MVDQHTDPDEIDPLEEQVRDEPNPELVRQHEEDQDPMHVMQPRARDRPARSGHPLMESGLARWSLVTPSTWPLSCRGRINPPAERVASWSVPTITVLQHALTGNVSACTREAGKL